jgi:hypothetical protein
MVATMATTTNARAFLMSASSALGKQTGASSVVVEGVDTSAPAA